MATRKKKRSSPKKRRRRGARASMSRRIIGTIWRIGRWPLLAGIAALALSLSILDRRITAQFEGRRWQVPARVFAQPLELYAGRTLTADDFASHLQALGYQEQGVAGEPGQFRRQGRSITLTSRPFAFWDGAQQAQPARVLFDGDRIRSVLGADEEALPLLRLDPVMIGSILPGSREDRIVLPPTQVPERLRSALVAVEDREFYSHHGVDLRAIARAAWVNLRAGRVRQGGSTLVQQLVKSYFLNNERTFSRKAIEALMAVLLDARYDKRALMNAYINEVFLGQDGARAVHGFALGSQFYFGVPLAELDDARIALLVAVIRGPSYYDPRRHPQRALERRNHVLRVLGEEGVLSDREIALAQAQALGVVARPGRVAGTSPAFMDVVRDQLARDYDPSDLDSAGLRIFTTLDTFAQSRAEAICASELALVERRGGVESGSLQLGAVVSDPQTGELLAAVGGRRPGYNGFNRAVAVRRPIGSLVKPFVYLGALGSGRYNLASSVPNRPLEVTLENGTTWEPRNYSELVPGDLPLYRALAESINLPAVHVGLDTGVDAVARQIEAAIGGIEVPRFPSLLLGALDLSPLQVAQAYATLATGGYVTPLRAVREVVDEQGAPLRRYPLRVRRSARDVDVAQIDAVLRLVMTHGTGRGAARVLPGTLTVAGKSGTSNDFRDGWFAGYSADRLAVVWVGRDDNASMGLSGSRSALPVWSQLMAQLARVPLEKARIEQLVDVPVEYESGMLAGDGCVSPVLLPLPRAAELPPRSPCAGDEQGSQDNGILQWLRDSFGGQ